jgi:hypothetical protein
LKIDEIKRKYLEEVIEKFDGDVKEAQKFFRNIKINFLPITQEIQHKPRENQKIKPDEIIKKSKIKIAKLLVKEVKNYETMETFICVFYFNFLNTLLRRKNR